MCKVAIQKALVAFKTDAGCKSEESFFIIGFAINLLNASFVGKVHREDSVLVDLAQDGEVIQVGYSFAQRNFVSSDGVKVNSFGAAVFLVDELFFKIGQRGIRLESYVDLVNEIEAHIRENLVSCVF